MKKTTSLFGLLVGSLMAITVAFVGLGNNVTYAQNVVCKLSVADYLKITDESIDVAKKLRVENDSRAARVHLDAMRQLISDSCDVLVDEVAPRRVSFQLHDGENLTDFETRRIALSKDYIDAVTQGNTALAARLALSIEQIKAGEKTELIVRREGTIVERTAEIRNQINNSREKIHSEFTTNRLCYDPEMYNRLTTIINSLEDSKRLDRLASSIKTLLATNPALQNSLEITLALTETRKAILDDRGSNPTWATPGFRNTRRPGFCLSVITADGLTITIDGTSYNTTKDANLFVTEPVALQDRTTYNLQVVVGDEMVFENAISFNVAKSADYKIAYNIHSPEALTITEVEVVEVLGCTDSRANNYKEAATKDDGSCTYDPEPVRGCTNPESRNYYRDATEDDGSCEPVPGCMDPEATNYSEYATEDDRSCTYGGGDR